MDISRQCWKGARDGALAVWLVGALFAIINAFCVPRAGATLIENWGQDAPMWGSSGTTYYMPATTSGGGMWIFSRMFVM